MSLLKHILILKNSKDPQKMAQVKFEDFDAYQRFVDICASEGLNVSGFFPTISFTAVDQRLIGYFLTKLSNFVEDPQDRQYITGVAARESIELDPNFTLPPVYAVYNDMYFHFTGRNPLIRSIYFLHVLTTDELSLHLSANDIETTNALKQALIAQGLPIDIALNNLNMSFRNHNRKHIAHYIHTIASVVPSIALIQPALIAKFGLDFNADFKVHTWVAAGSLNEQKVAMKLHYSLAKPGALKSIFLYSSENEATQFDICLRDGFEFQTSDYASFGNVDVQKWGASYISFKSRSNDMQSLMCVFGLVRYLVGNDYDEIEGTINKLLTLAQRKTADADVDPDIDDIVALFNNFSLQNNDSLTHYIDDLLAGIREVGTPVPQMPALQLHKNKRNDDDDNDQECDSDNDEARLKDRKSRKKA